MPRKTAPKVPPRRVNIHGDVAFFMAIIMFLLFTLGSIIVAQKITLRYMMTEFPRVAERNYRTLQDDLRAMEERMSRQMETIYNACAPARGGWLLPPDPEAADPERMTP
ncbi:MAG: hypothetical protein G01um101431_252 [Parcubacteria group bacterium Gr01-1014_31]|nr:MAG: hypothetical protein G01um101431_252 [Parcubacteria group bacterium Gr01-1014_31]